MEYTQNYRLSKPGGGEYIDVNTFNANMDGIDAELKGAEEHRVADAVRHITAAERTTWNAMAPAGRKVNNKALTTDITLTAADVGARPGGWNPSLADCGGTLAVGKGGTGATTAALARNALGITPANIGAAASSHGTHVSYSGSAPLMDGTAAAGAAATVARSDHRHPADTGRAAAGHTHDERYYTEGEADALLEEKANISVLRRPNLLDNGDFSGPVNQRGRTEYAALERGAYTIDRWMGVGVAGAKINAANGRVLLTNATDGSGVTFIQKFHAGPGETYTWAVRDTNGVIYHVSGVLGEGYVSKQTHFGQLYFVRQDGVAKCFIQLTRQPEFAIAWAKFELGDRFTGFAPRGYGEELARCQRYFYHVAGRWKFIGQGVATTANEVAAYVSLPVIPRIIPVPTFHNLRLAGGLGAEYADFSVANIRVAQSHIGGVELAAQVAGTPLTLGAPYWLAIKSESGSFSLDANL